MALKKNDFIEIEFIGKVKDGEVFDSNIRSEVEKLHHDHEHKLEAKPFIFSLGQGMFLPAIDDFLIGKPEEKASYEIELQPEKAFGKRDSKFIQMVPLKVFYQQQINPIPGAMLNMDGRLAKILTVSGGRVMVDFNHPLAGKNVVYTLKISRIVDDLNDKIKAFVDFLFRRELEFEVKESLIILKVEKQMIDFVKIFADKFKEIFGLELKVEEEKEKKQEGSKELNKKAQ
jgi:FKBP-type peptidyl-prolyl cis-trans isomerase 2